jgi:nucleoside-diphosphate-sugar epimerase
LRCGDLSEVFDIKLGVGDIKDERVLVTGARGFIGGVTCRFLASQGAEVYGVGRSKAGSPGSTYAYESVDLTGAKTTLDYIIDICPRFIIHLAGCTVASRELEWVQTTFAANLQSTVNVLSAASQAGVEKVVIAGSLEQPDESSVGSTLSSPYAASKWAATGYSKMFHAVSGIQVATARIFMVYGPGQKELQKLVPYACLSTIAGKSPKITSGSRDVDWIYVDDVAEGLIRLLLNGPVNGSLVDIGTGRLVSTGEIAEKICELTESEVSPLIGAVPNRPMEQVRKADIEQTYRQIGWSPKTSLEDGLETTLAWYKLNHAAL